MSRVGRGCPCHLAGRSLRASCPALTPRKLASASCLSLACEAGERARATPPPDPRPHKSPGREPGDCGNKGHPAIHAAPHTRHRLSLAVSNWVATSQSPSLRWGLLLRHAVRTGSRSCLSLACEAGERARATPPPDPLPHKSPGREPGDREPGDFGNKRQLTIHPANRRRWNACSSSRIKSLGVPCSEANTRLENSRSTPKL